MAKIWYLYDYEAGTWHVYKGLYIEFPSGTKFFATACGRLLPVPSETTATPQEPVCPRCKRGVVMSHRQFKLRTEKDHK